jgi:hypothetical protein
VATVKRPTIGDRIRATVARLGAAHAYVGDDPDPVCFWIDDAPMTVARARRALAMGKCPLCVWAIGEFFGHPVDIIRPTPE